MSGWIKLHRSLVDWEWYDDPNATRLLIHLLITVNYEDKKWHGILIKSGSRITSWEHLADEVGLSIRQTRTAVEKLEQSKEITRNVTNRFQLITLVKWEQLQAFGSEDDKQMTGKRQTDDKQATTTKEREEVKEGEESKEQGVIFPFDSEEFFKWWNFWKDYKLTEWKF